MKRCKAQTKSGQRCLNLSKVNGDFCSIHKDQISQGKVIAVGLGAAIGHVLAPGLGGAILGSVAGHLVQSLTKGESMAKTRAFVSFDFDNDRVLKDFILGQAKLVDSPFEVIDHTLKEAAPENDWERKARAAIGRSQIVLVMVGPNTYRAQGVLKEVAMAREARVKIVQIIGYKDGNYTPVPNAGRLYAWNWGNLKILLG